MNKKNRQLKLMQLIQGKRIENQQQLLLELSALGLDTNQATVSRDLNELGIIKMRGIYRVAQVSPGESRLVGILETIPVGEHLIIIKTPAGQANVVGIEIDDAKLHDVAGTVAGDDAIFVAVHGKTSQKQTMRWILDHFRRHTDNK